MNKRNKHHSDVWLYHKHYVSQMMIVLRPKWSLLYKSSIKYLDSLMIQQFHIYFLKVDADGVMDYLWNWIFEIWFVEF